MRSTRHPVVKSDNDRDWQKYCGFFNLTTDQFMAVQGALLSQQLERLTVSPLGRKLLGDRLPQTVDEFRSTVPLTTYQDYLPEFQQSGATALPEEPYLWARTSAASGTFKYVPYTREFYYSMLDNLMAAFILACSEKKGQSRLTEGDKVLFNVAPSPYLSGILASGACEVFNLEPVMPADRHDDLDFKDKVAEGFRTSLRTGADILVAMTSVLVKLGNDFGQMSRSQRTARRVSHPAVMYRFAKAFLRSKLQNRDILPKDLWPLKAIIGWGIDTRIYREQVRQSWGIYPYELHACTEAGIMALQGWNQRDLTLLPHSNFFEFIPEEECLKLMDNVFVQPSTRLLPELQPGRRYELVITSFHGMPFVRYRLGHLIRVTALEDEEMPVRLPQIVFEARTDELIDIAGFTRVSEKAVAQAIADAGVKHEDWVIRKETSGDRIILRLYIESSGGHGPEELTTTLQRTLADLDPGYGDLERMMGLRPLRVTVLRPGTFADYYARKKESGAELLQRKPSRMNPPEEITRELVQISDTQRVSAVR